MISTEYMGLKLSSPVIVASGPLTQNILSLKKAEEAGAGAVVLKSIFEEQIESDVSREMEESAEYLTHSSAEDFYASSSRDRYIDRYMKLLAEAKKTLSIPVIASVSAKTMDSWIDYAERFVKCGADGIELNYYPISSEASVSGADVDKRFLSFAQKARDAIDAPLSIKMGYKYSSLAYLISQLDRIGIDGLVLFNRFFRPDIDIEKIEIAAGSPVSQSDEYGEALRWIGLMSGEIKADLCGNTGIHDGASAVKMLLSGFDQNNPPEVNDKIKTNLKQAVDEAIVSVREISANISPHILNNFGLKDAIESFLKKLRPNENIKIHFDSNIDKLRFPYNVEVIMYRVVCELINNTLRHAEATEINISLQLQDDTLYLEYTDNGMGFDVEQAEIDGGMGLNNMQYRLQSGNGNIRIESEGGRGMRARAYIKCK